MLGDVSCNKEPLESFDDHLSVERLVVVEPVVRGLEELINSITSLWSFTTPLNISLISFPIFLNYLLLKE